MSSSVSRHYVVKSKSHHCIPDLNKADAEYMNQQCDWITAAH